MNRNLCSAAGYRPAELLDAMIIILGLKNDAALSRILEIGPPVLSKIRHGRLPISSALLIRVHEITGISISELRGLMGDRRFNHRASPSRGRPGHAIQSNDAKSNEMIGHA
jgi:hypothetical protein